MCESYQLYICMKKSITRQLYTLGSLRSSQQNILQFVVKHMPRKNINMTDVKWDRKVGYAHQAVIKHNRQPIGSIFSYIFPTRLFNTKIIFDA